MILKTLMNRLKDGPHPAFAPTICYIVAVHDPQILSVNVSLIEPQSATIDCYEIIGVECSFEGTDSTTDARSLETCAMSLGVERFGAHFGLTALKSLSGHCR